MTAAKTFIPNRDEVISVLKDEGLTSAQIARRLSRSYAGVGNPNFKNASSRTCQFCGCEFHRYNKDAKFCSHKCYVDSKPKKPVVEKAAVEIVKKEYVPHPKEIVSKIVNCTQCGKEFRKFPSQTKRFCSYKCHLDSGGAFRAGMEAARAKMRYGAKKDANHKEIFDEFNRLDIPVKDLSVHGCGLPDGLAWICDAWHLFDVKNLKTAYGRRGLNEVQKKWVGQWKGGPVYLIHSIEEVAKFAAGDFSSLKKEGGKCETTPEKV